MHDWALLLFAVTYAGIALGHVPGLALDRTGIALLGAIAMVATGVLPMGEALASVSMPTILLLYALMVVSAQLRLSGGYTAAAVAVSRLAGRPRLFLAILMGLSGALSALLVNDIVCLGFTPVVAVATLRAGLNPVPFLLGLAMASNIGSAATIIGNPQNMLIGQVGHLGFARFLAFCAPPSLLALAGAYGVLLRLYRGRLQTVVELSDSAGEDWPVLDRHQCRKGVLAVVLLIGLFFTPWPRELVALTVAAWLLASRQTATRDLLGRVDWHLITLFCALFIVIRGLETTGVPEWLLAASRGAGFDPARPVGMALLSALLSNLVSNVPAVMLLVRFLDPGDPTAWYSLALASTFAGNLIVIGSIANLIVIEQAARHGIRISFREHARAGIPVTLLSMAILLGWLALLR